MARLHLIFIPGLGDRGVSKQKSAVNTWRIWGVEAEILEMHWADKEPWDKKFDTLLARIDELASRQKCIALVGASAGASAVINAYAARKKVITGCVLIAGKVNRPDLISSRYRSENPAFATAAVDCQAALHSLNAIDRKRILSIYALADETVYRPDSFIPMAHNRVAPTIGHVFTIATQLTVGAPFFIHFLNQLPSVNPI